MRKTADDRKNDLIRGLTTARQDLLAVVQSIPAGQLEAPCVGSWDVKDLLAHLIGWDETNLVAIQEILSGKRPTFFQFYDKDWQTYNATLVSQHRREPFSALLADIEGSHRKLVAFLNSLMASQVLEGKSPPDQGRPVTIRRLLRAEADNERKHTQQVQAFFQRPVL